MKSKGIVVYGRRLLSKMLYFDAIDHDDFVIVAFAIFMAIKLINRLNRKKEEPAAAPAPTKEEVLLSEIRDLLKEQNNRV